MRSFRYVLVTIALLRVVPAVPAAPEVTTTLTDFSSLSTAVSVDAKGTKIGIDVTASDSLTVDRLTIRRGAFACGTIELGPLLRLIDSPAGDWGRAPPASIQQTAGSVWKSGVPPEFGAVVPLVPGAISIFVVRDLSALVAGGYISGQSGPAVRWEALSTISRLRPNARADPWMFEYPPDQSPAFAHTLARLAMVDEPFALTLGGVISSSTAGAPGIGGSCSAEVSSGSFVLSAGVAGTDADYRDFRGDAGETALQLSWSLTRRSDSGSSMKLHHRVEFEQLPAMLVPYRETSETVVFEAATEADRLSAGGGIEVHLDGGRSGFVEAVVGGEASLSYSGEVFSCGLDAELSISPEERHLDVSLPWHFRPDRYSVAGALDLSLGDGILIRGALELAVELGPVSEVFVRCRTREPFDVARPDQASSSDDSFGVLSIELGWRVQGSPTS